MFKFFSMKISLLKTIALLLCFVSLESFEAAYPTVKAEVKNAAVIKTPENVQNWYATTGVTRGFGPNYSINIRVKGSQGFNGCVIISEVQVSNGYGWSSAMYNRVMGEDCTYSVTVSGRTYYFKI